MNARDIMSANPVVVRVDTSIAEALEVLQSAEVRHLPVVEDGEVVGMLSDRDFRAAYLSPLADEAALDKLKARMRASVNTIMSADVVSVAPEADLSEIIDCMLENKIGAVPVVDERNDELVGIVSYVDILRAQRDALD